MSVVLKVTQIGGPLGVILPKEVIGALKVENGDTLILSETPGGVLLSSAVTRQLEIGRKVMHERRHALRELAKK